MGFMDKVKNFFYEDVEDDTEVAKRVSKPKVKEKVKEQVEEFEVKEDIKEKNDDISEMELFKSERTFNFPMDLGDDIFDDEPIEKNNKLEEKKSYSRENRNLYSGGYSGISRAKLTAETNKKDDAPKRFKPTPVVSPVYGILDKNYTVDDVIDKNLSKTKEFSIEKKTVDYDTVRNRAYKELDEEIEKTLTGQKDIFFNLDEAESNQEEKTNEDYEFDNDDVVITFDNDETEYDKSKEDQIVIENQDIDSSIGDNEEEADIDLEPDIEIPIVKKRSKKKESKEEKTEKEDLFNLIDNMYKDEEEDEE